MRVQALFFAVTRDLAGVAEASVELTDEAPTVGDFVRAIEATYPGLAGRMESVRIARNERFAALDAPLADGDVLALVPPVSGG
jgi:sulfur-carrier protein